MSKKWNNMCIGRSSDKHSVFLGLVGYSNLNGRSYKLEKYQKKLNVRFVIGDMNSRLRNWSPFSCQLVLSVGTWDNKNSLYENKKSFYLVGEAIGRY